MGQCSCTIVHSARHVVLAVPRLFSETRLIASVHYSRAQTTCNGTLDDPPRYSAMRLDLPRFTYLWR